MADLLAPPQFNEAFTLYLDAAGSPVTRTLREMTAGEVAAALEWQTAEANRLMGETESFAELVNAVEAGTVDEATPAEELEAAGQAMIRAGEANLKLGRLKKLVGLRRAAPRPYSVT